MAASFRWAILCVLTHLTWKLQVVFGCSTSQTTVLLSKTFLLWFSARELWPQKRHHDHSLQQYCVHTASITKRNTGCMQPYYTPIDSIAIPRMILLVLKVAKQSQSSSFGPVHTSLFGAPCLHEHFITRWARAQLILDSLHDVCWALLGSKACRLSAAKVSMFGTHSPRVRMISW